MRLARHPLSTLSAMRNKGLALGITLTMLAVPLSFSASTDEVATQIKATNPVSELRNQDSAFSLLMEAFRMVQGRVIQTDYEHRLQAADALSDLKTRRHVVELVNQ